MGTKEVLPREAPPRKATQGSNPEKNYKGKHPQEFPEKLPAERLAKEALPEEHPRIALQSEAH